MKIAIVILTKDRPIQFRDMIESIKAVTPEFSITVCDNGSTDPGMIAYLNSLEDIYTVIYNGSNKGIEGFNPGLALIKEDFFILSDPDILLNKDMPKDWVEKATDLLYSYPTPKVGLALKIDFEPKNKLQKRIQGIERTLWESPISIPLIGQPCYLAPVDTTFALYRRDSYTFWDHGLSLKPGIGLNGDGTLDMEKYNTNKYPVRPIRVGGTWTAEHLGWYYDRKYFPDLEWYLKNANYRSSSLLWKVSEDLSLYVDGLTNTNREQTLKYITSEEL